MNDLNPYATTGAFDPPPPELLWYTEGLTVYARNGTTLPAIELETGEEGEHLVAVSRNIRKISGFGFIGVPILILLYVFLKVYEPLRGSQAVVWMALPFLMGGVRLLVEKIWPQLKPKNIVVEVFRDREIVRKDKIRQWCMAITAICSIGIMVSAAPLYVWYGEPKLISLAILGLGGIIATGIYGYFHRSKIHLSAGQDYWMRFGNVSQTALSKLQEIESRSKTRSSF